MANGLGPQRLPPVRSPLQAVSAGLGHPGAVADLAAGLDGRRPGAWTMGAFSCSDLNTPLRADNPLGMW